LKKLERNKKNTNKSDIKYYILPLYLTVVVLLQIELIIQNILLAVIPIIVIIFSIYLKNKKIGITGLFLFYTVSLSLIIVKTMDNYVLVFLQLIFLILPSIILLNQILQIQNKQIFIISNKKKPIAAAITSFILIFGVFYYITISHMEGLLLSTESISGQIILLAGLSIVCCGPLLIFSKK